MVYRKRVHTAFTLIELLIVVGIIGILAAIAIPNYLEAQVRSKVARVKSDLRTIHMAIEAYYTDHNEYPVVLVKEAPGQVEWGPDVDFCGMVFSMFHLSTPVAYLGSTSYPDPFVNVRVRQITSSIFDGPVLDAAPSADYCDVPQTYLYTYCPKAGNNNVVGETAHHGRVDKWEANRPEIFLLSVGPDKIVGPDVITGKFWSLTLYTEASDYTGENTFTAWNYDPSNGSVSNGDIMQHYSKD